MNWEKFLKPDWQKIVIFGIFFILIFFIPFNCHYIALPTPVGVEGGSVNFCTSIYQYDMESVICCLRPISAVIETLSYQLIPIIIFSYLLSCLIVWIYDKVKKRKK